MATFQERLDAAIKAQQLMEPPVPSTFEDRLGAATAVSDKARTTAGNLRTEAAEEQESQPGPMRRFFQAMSMPTTMKGWQEALQAEVSPRNLFGKMLPPGVGQILNLATDWNENPSLDTVGKHLDPTYALGQNFGAEYGAGEGYWGTAGAATPLLLDALPLGMKAPVKRASSLPMMRVLEPASDAGILRKGTGFMVDDFLSKGPIIGPPLGERFKNWILRDAPQRYKPTNKFWDPEDIAFGNAERSPLLPRTPLTMDDVAPTYVKGALYETIKDATNISPPVPYSLPEPPMTNFGTPEVGPLPQPELPNVGPQLRTGEDWFQPVKEAFYGDAPATIQRGGKFQRNPMYGYTPRPGDMDPTHVPPADLFELGSQGTRVSRDLPAPPNPADMKGIKSQVAPIRDTFKLYEDPDIGPQLNLDQPWPPEFNGQIFLRQERLAAMEEAAAAAAAAKAAAKKGKKK